MNSLRLLDAILSAAIGTSIDLYFGDNAGVKVLIITNLYGWLLIVGGWILVYRLYHVYCRNVWICILPTITILALLATISVLTWRMANTHAIGVFQELIQPWLLTTLALTLFINLYCTIFIGIKMYRNYRSVTQLIGTSRLIVRR